MQDLNLAFLVGRLMESSCFSKVKDSFSTSSAFGDIVGFGSGGYLSVLPSVPETSDNITFDKWRPTLGNETRRVLMDRMLPLLAQDHTLSATTIIWLDKREEASWILAGIVDTAFGSKNIYKVLDGGYPIYFRNLISLQNTTSNGLAARYAPLERANTLVDLVSSPILLNFLRAGDRVEKASILRVACALKDRGAELSALRFLNNFPISQEVNQDKINGINNEIEQSDDDGEHENNSKLLLAYSSSIDNLDAIESQHSTPAPVSSIFDEFDIAPTATLAKQKQPCAKPSSSIFDEFDVPPPSKKQETSTTDIVTEMQSSIFDNFDVMPTMRKSTVNKNQSDDMNSSIFSDFDIPSTARKQKQGLLSTSTQLNDMQSSIFDSFDVTPVSQGMTNSTCTPSSSLVDRLGISPASKQEKSVPEVQSSIFDSFDVPPIVKNNQYPVSSRQVESSAVSTKSSLCDSFDITSGKEKGYASMNKVSDINSSKRDKDIAAISEVETLLPFRISKERSPYVWLDWKDALLLETSARRLCREIASVLAQFHGDPVDPPIEDFYRCHDLLLSSRASEVLQLPCDARRLLGRILQSFEELCAAGALHHVTLLNKSIELLGSFYSHRPLFAIVLFSAVGKSNHAEELVRQLANSLINICNIFAIMYDDTVYEKKTRVFVASQGIRQESARLSWQLESALWLHRGGGLPLSGTALNEAIVAVRIGLMIASWNRNFRCLDAMIRSEPDCHLDEDTGRQLWTSLKAFDTRKKDTASKNSSSGGWEFLVNCRRSQATDLLRNRATGSFLIRPHPGDHGVFTISFKTNLVPGSPVEDNGGEHETRSIDTPGEEQRPSDDEVRLTRPRKKHVRKDDVVQHAIIRLSDSGFRCGSFGPFTSLMSLLEAVSASLPFKLRFDLPPKNRVIKDEGYQTSPNAVFLRRLSLKNSWTMTSSLVLTDNDGLQRPSDGLAAATAISFEEQQSCLGVFLDLMLLSLVIRQLSSVASAQYDDSEFEELSSSKRYCIPEKNEPDSQFASAARILNPILTWCRFVEIASMYSLAPGLEHIASETFFSSSHSVTQSDDAIEVAPLLDKRRSGNGDSILRKMIQQSSGIDFSTLRLIDGGECTMVVLFSKTKAIEWLLSNGKENSEADAQDWLKRMEDARVIEPVNLSNLPIKPKGNGLSDHGVRYRFVDPWEVEAVQNREGETRSASLGRDRFLGFSIGQVSASTEIIIRSLGGVSLLELWSTMKGSVYLTKALASVYPPWERDAGGDLHVRDGVHTEPSAYLNSIRQCLYRNTLFRRLGLPQRFLALVQVELLDLKNLTIPGGSLSITAYALLRLKRAGSGSILTNKARTLDSAATVPMKLNKASGPNAPASWGSVVRFRFPLPEDVTVDGVSYDTDRDILFNGPPCILQISVYEKKLLVDHSLGRADISTDGLWAGGQLEEWVPLRSEKRGIKWFARVRLTLRFELMCLANSDESRCSTSSVPSAGLKKIEDLCSSGGSAHEDVQKRSLSSPDLLTYFEGMVYYSEP